MNTGFRSSKEPKTALDFMPSQFSKKHPEKVKEKKEVKRRKRKTIAFELQTTMSHFLR